MKQKDQFTRKNLIIFLICATSAATVLYITTRDQITQPSTDVVGGSSLFETNTLQYIVYFVSYLITMIALGIAIGRPIVEERATRKQFHKRTYNLIEIIRNSKFGITPRVIVLVLLAAIVISRYISFVAFLIIEKRFLPLSNLLIFRDWNVAVILLISLAGTLYVAKKLLTVDLFESIALTMPLGAISLLYFTLSNTLGKFENNNETDKFSLFIIALLFGNIIYVLQVYREKITPEKVLYIGILAGVYSFLFRIPDSINNLNYFEDYPILNVHAYNNWGFQPWSELQLNHGLYHDFLRPLVGTWFVNDSVWGMQAGIQAILFPLEVILVLYFLGNILRNRMFTLYAFLILAAIVKVIPGDGLNSWLFIYSLPRAIPLLFCTIALRRVVENKSVIDHALFAVSVSVSTIWASENLVIWLICGLAAFYFTILTSKNKFNDVKKLILSAVVIPLVSIYSTLVILNLSTAFLNDYEGLSSNVFQGALAFNFKAGLAYSLSVLGLPLLFGYFGIKYGKQLRKGVLNSELILIPSLAVGVYYYVKFLAWPDLHIQQATNALNVIWIYILYQFWIFLAKDKNIANLVRVSSVAVIVVTLVLNLAPTRLQTPKIGTPEVQFFGPVTSSFAAEISRYKKLKSHLQKKTGVEEPMVLDFTNSPVFVHLLPNLKFVPDLEFTSFYVSYSQQLSALRNILNSPPDAIILNGPIGLSNGVFPGEMFQRNYLMSKYVLENYQEVERYEDFSILTRGGSNLNSGNLQDLLNSNSLTCNWFKALNSVPRLSKANQFNENIDVSDLGNLLSLGAKLKDVTGFKVLVSNPGIYSISANRSAGKFVPLATFEATSRTRMEIFVPVDSCPAWGLNSSPLKSIEISGQGAKLVGVVVATGSPT